MLTSRDHFDPMTHCVLIIKINTVNMNAMSSSGGVGTPASSVFGAWNSCFSG